MIESSKSSTVFFSVLALLLMYSVSVTYYKYIVAEDFVYFLTEEEVPDQFEVSAYLE